MAAGAVVAAAVVLLQVTSPPSAQTQQCRNTSQVYLGMFTSQEAWLAFQTYCGHVSRTGFTTGMSHDQHHVTQAGEGLVAAPGRCFESGQVSFYASSPRGFKSSFIEH